MTKILIDGREIEPAIGFSSIGEILNYVDEEHLAGNSAVSQIRINGHPFLPNGFSEEVQQGMAHEIERMNSVEISTGNVVDVARASVCAAFEFLDRAEAIMLSLTKSCRHDISPAPLTDLRQLYEGFCLLDLLLDKLKADCAVPLEDTPVGKGFELEHRRNFIAALRRFKESLEKSDYVRMVDLLEQEMHFFVPYCRKMLLAVDRAAGWIR